MAAGHRMADQRRCRGDLTVAFPMRVLRMAGIGLRDRAALLHPEFQCTNIDISGSLADADIQTLVGLVRDGNAEQQIAVRGDRRLVARYRRATSSVEAPPIHSDATYLITGGLGGIGRVIARCRCVARRALAGAREPEFAIA